MSVIIGTCQILLVFILGTSITNIPSDNATNWSYIKKVIKMVISNETICAPEQGYMFFPSLKYTALLPTIAGYQLLPPENKTFIFQLWLYILKALCCVFFPLTLVIVLPYLLGLLLW